MKDSQFHKDNEAETFENVVDIKGISKAFGDSNILTNVE